DSDRSTPILRPSSVAVPGSSMCALLVPLRNPPECRSGLIPAMHSAARCRGEHSTGLMSRCHILFVRGSTPNRGIEREDRNASQGPAGTGPGFVRDDVVQMHRAQSRDWIPKSQEG